MTAKTKYQWFLFSIVFIVHYCLCVRVNVNVLHFHKFMGGNLLESKYAKTLSVCVYECLVVTDCVSFSFNFRTKWCRLHSETSFTAPETLRESTKNVLFSDVTAWPKVSRIEFYIMTSKHLAT